MTLNDTLPLIPLDFLGYAKASALPCHTTSQVPVSMLLAADEADEAVEDEDDLEDDDEDEEDDDLEDDDEDDDDDEDEDEDDEEEELDA